MGLNPPAKTRKISPRNGAVAATYNLMKFVRIIALLLWSSLSAAHAVVLFTYDFPGSPGSGLAANQTNPQPSGATFSDFTRNGGLVGLGAGGQFDSNNWTGSGTIDTTQYDAFTITASAGHTIDLSQLDFDVRINGSGPLNGRVALFLNGSATAYATFDFTPPGAITTMTFNFTPLTDADNVSTATFEFFGWNSTPPNGSMRFDNVITYGTVVPEPSTWLAGLAGIAIAAFEGARQMRRQRLAATGRKRRYPLGRQLNATTGPILARKNSCL
jgi:hypothetical protein